MCSPLRQSQKGKSEAWSIWQLHGWKK